MKNIYILLSHTGTIPSKIIKRYTGDPYSHASISVDDNFETFYSFGRLRLNNPIVGGFVEEKIGKGIYKKFNKSKMLLLKFEVKEDEFEAIISIINRFIDNRDIYRYNYLGLVGSAINKSIPNNKRYFCSEFVAHVLMSSGVDMKCDTPQLMKPFDFAKDIRFEKIYEGNMLDLYDSLQ